MSDPISVTCPKCNAKLKLKSSAAGKKVACPKCKKAFVAPAPSEDDEFGFMNVSEPEPDEFDEFSEQEEQPDDEAPAPVMSSRSRKKGGKSKKSQPINWQKPVGIALGALLLVGLLVGGGYLVANLDLFGPKNKIDLAYLPPEADFVVHAKLSETWNAPFMQSIVTMPMVKGGVDQMRQETGIDPNDVTSITFGMKGFAEQMKATAEFRKQLMAGPQAGGFKPPPQVATESIAVVRFKAPVDEGKFRTQAKLTDGVQHQGATYYREAGRAGALAAPVVWFAKADVLLIGPENDIKGAIERGPKSVRRADLDFIDPTRQVLVVMVPKDPSAFDQSGGGPLPGMPATMTKLQDVTKGKLKGFCLGLSAGEGIDLAMQTDCTTPEAAKEIAAEIDKAIQDAKNQFAQAKAAMPPQMAELVTLADSVLSSVQTKSVGGGFQVSATIPGSVKSTIEKLPSMLLMGMMPGSNPFGGLGSGLGQTPPATASLGGAPGQETANPLGGFGSDPAIANNALDALAAAGQGGANSSSPVENAAGLAKSRNNLKQIALAMHMYHDKNGAFPAYANHAGGKPLLSWRVHLLPYLGQEALYKEFHLNEPWDSTHNTALAARMPDVFRCPASKAAAGMTNYVVARGEGTAFEGEQPVAIKDILDGSSRTILVLEIADGKAVPWTKPADLEFAGVQTRQDLAGPFGGGFLTAFADGAVYFIKDAVPLEIVKLLVMRNDKQPIPDAAWK